MATRVIHFGPDDCHRRMVRQSAGYSVDECHSLGELRDCLLTATAFEAVFMSEAEGLTPEDAASITRMHSCVPVILFRGTNLSYEESQFDLVIHALTPPDVWLNEVETLIERGRAERTDSEILADGYAVLESGERVASGQARG
jgi:hypothetical protein